MIVSLDGKPVQGRVELIESIGAFEPGSEVEIEVRRGDAVQKLKITLARLPEDLPPKDLPPAVQPADARCGRSASPAQRD